jgi:hypothetical protein
MTCKHQFLAVAVAVAASFAAACGPLRLDDTRQIVGTLVTVDGQTIGIKHKTGGTYYVEVTPETRIVDSGRQGTPTLCRGQRATVVLTGQRRFVASSITLWGGDCR